MVEMIVGLTIMGIVLAIAIPNLAGSAKMHRLRSAASEMHTTLLRARSAAVTQGSTVRIEIDPDAGTFVIRHDTDNDGTFDRTAGPHDIPKGIQVAQIDFDGAMGVEFNTRGVPSAGGEIHLASSGGDMRIVRVAAGSGAVSVVSH